MKNAKLLLTTGLAAITVSLGAGTQKGWAAGQEDKLLIDKPFEQCLIKHVQKRFFNRIGASADQKEKLSRLFATRAEETRPLREKLRQEAVELSELMGSMQATDDEIVAKANQVKEIRDQVMDQRMQSALAVRKELNADQRKLIADRISGLISGRWQSRLMGDQ